MKLTEFPHRTSLPDFSSNLSPDFKVSDLYQDLSN
jgi:hypothetical protein